MDSFTQSRCSRCFRRSAQPFYRTCAECRQSGNMTREDQPTPDFTDSPRPSKRRLDDPNPRLTQQPSESVAVPSAPVPTPINEPVAAPHLIFQTRAVPLNINRAKRRRLQRIAPSFSPFPNETQHSQQAVPPPRPVLIPHRDPSPKQPDEHPDIGSHALDDDDGSDNAGR
jgi:hypothetical protein